MSAPIPNSRLFRRICNACPFSATILSWALGGWPSASRILRRARLRKACSTRDLDESSCEALEFTYRCPADYAAGSVSFGGLAHVVPDHFDIKVDLSTAVRFPNVDELYVIGHSPSLPVYATGYPSLGTETVWNGSLTSGLRSDFVEFEASVYAQVIEDYIYFSPVLNSLGNPKVEVTIRGAYPAWDFQPIDARFAGVDGSLLLGPESAMGFRAVGDSWEHPPTPLALAYRTSLALVSPRVGS